MNTNTFSELNLSEPILAALAELNYSKPSPIQTKTIPIIQDSKDVLATAQTGTGKSASFLLPILQKLSTTSRTHNCAPRALILVPTRELAIQLFESCKKYGKYLSLEATFVIGGVNINPQIRKFKNKVDILIATPGRLLDLHKQKAVNLKTIERLVLDEADRMLDMGFIHDIRKLFAIFPKSRQTLLFSATFSKEIENLSKLFLKNPVKLSVSPPNSTVKSIEQSYYKIEKQQKKECLKKLLNEKNIYQALIFSRTKHEANKLVTYLNKQKFSAAAIHGNKSQSARIKALTDFKNEKISILVATDIASRGLDIDKLPFVINFHLPEVAEDYVHRIGRTGRAGETGQAISLVSSSEIKLLKSIEKCTKEKITYQAIDGFENIDHLEKKPNWAFKKKLSPFKKKHTKNKTNQS